ncbi:hypothetical protein JRC49_14870 [Clostridiales bacterium FE2011]|nr:hypothetical protein JRC49_14870 [Clostridiales bacterium FE2011]
MKKFEIPQMNVMKLASENVFTDSQCTVEALGCVSCYCVAVECNEAYIPENPPEDPNCPTHW